MTDAPEEIVDPDDRLPGIVADLVRAGVGVVVEAGTPHLIFDPADRRAAALAARSKAALGDNRDRAIALFARLRAEAPADGPVRRTCAVCRAAVFLGGGVTAADVWAACGVIRRPPGDNSGLLVIPDRPADCPWRPRAPLAVAHLTDPTAEAA